jgi:shikimate kinase
VGGPALASVSVLVTGLSGVGKSSALAELERLGYRVVDTDHGGWSEWSDAEGGWVWREDRMARLLQGDPPQFISGCVSNQGKFYDRFAAVVLLSAPLDVMLNRIGTRTTNDYGKDTSERQQIVSEVEAVEPLLRATATHELDATRPLAEVVDALAAIAAG